MAKKMALPKIGVNMTEAVIAKWLVKVGDTVKEGDAIIEAETDKSTQEIYATEEGIVAKLLFDEGQTAQCYDEIMVLTEVGETYSEEVAKTAPPTAQITPQPTATPVAQRVVPVPSSSPSEKKTAQGRIIASPLAKKMAKEMGIDLSNVAYEGKRIKKDDVLAYSKIMGSLSAGRSLAQSFGENLDIIPMSPIRKVIAKRMSESNLEKPCAALTLSADVSEFSALRALYKEKGIKVGIDALMAKVVAKALLVHRNINSVLDGDNILIKRDINIGVAVDTAKGLTVPVLKNADVKPLSEMAEEYINLVQDAQDGSLSTDALCGGTFTITNLGMFGIESFTPVINPPECCILALGAIKDEFVPDANGLPVLAKKMQMTLVFDHRIVDGAPAAKFLKLIKDYVECPQLLI